MALINTTILKPGNVLLITAIAIGSHIIAKPLYKAIASKKG